VGQVRLHRPLAEQQRGRHQTAAARHVREHPVAFEPSCIGLPRVEETLGVVRPIEREQRLDVVGHPPAFARLTPAEPGGRRLRPAEPVEGGARVAGLQADLLLAELQGSLRVGAGELELAAMGGSRGDRQMDPGNLEPVLDAELVGAIGVLGRELPAVAQQLDIGKPGERFRGHSSSRSCHSWYLRSMSARASSRLRRASSASAIRPFALSRSTGSPLAVASAYARAAWAGASGSPAAQPRKVRMASASTRRSPQS